MWKWLRAIGLMVGLVLAIVGLFYFLRPSAAISRMNFNKIRPGMTAKQVEAILGPATASTEDEEIQVWHGDDATIQIKFIQGRLINKTFVSDPPCSQWPRFLEMLGFPRDSPRE